MTLEPTVAARVPADLRTDLLTIAARHDEDLSHTVRRLLRQGADVELQGVARPGNLFMQTAGLGDLDAALPSHAGGPETERDAARFAFPRAANSRRRILDYLATRGTYGATSDELVHTLTMFSAQRRLHDLKRGNWVEVLVIAGEPVRRTTRQGAEADVYVLTPAAISELAKAPNG